MTRTDLIAFLDAQGIAHATLDHASVFHVGEAAQIKAALEGVHTKNLFLEDAKRALFLLSARDDAVIDLKALAGRIGSARLSFGAAPILQAALGVTPGSVTAFALANDTGRRVAFVLDRALWDADLVNFHPLENTATTTITGEGLRRFLAALRIDPILVDFP